MGYNTDFTGTLKFTKELTSKQLAKISSFFGEDCREHSEWGNTELTWIDLKLTKDFSGIEWNGSEKTYQLVEKVNLIIEQMQKEYPDFGLEGEILAQGEDIDDRWILAIENCRAVEKPVVIKGTKVCCPNCSKEFIAEENISFKNT